MIKVYIINMDRNPERMAFMRSNFEKLGIPFERFPAVDGRALGEEAFQCFANARPAEMSGDSYTPNGRKWTPSKMGCFLSHYSLWQIAATSPDRFTAIFEDDLHIAGSLKDFLTDDQWIPAECEVIRFEASYNRIKLVNPPLVKIAGRELSRVIASNFEHCWPIGNGGYLMSRDAARKLIAVPERLHSIGTDHFIYNKLKSPIAANIATCQVVHALCIQDKFLHQRTDNIVYKSEIELTGPTILNESVIQRLTRKLRSFALVLLGYRRVVFMEHI